MTSSRHQPQSWNATLRTALAVLADGKPRSAGAILSDGLAARLVRPGAKAETIYDSLQRYVQRARALGRRTLIVMDEERRFRLDQPPDDWPEPLVRPTRPPVQTGRALVAALRATSGGDDPDAFEAAVCETFAALGFVARHLGGREAPDGTLDAPLGPLSYRAVLECKTWRGERIPRLDVAEAAKYREAFHADVALLVAPALAEYDTELNAELATHRVSGWTIDDLAQLLDAAVDPHELRPVLVPGLAADYLGDILWARRHGAPKRVAVATELLWRIGWEQQCALVGAAEPPLLTEDAAMLLVDQALQTTNPTASVDRQTIRAAIAELVSPQLSAASFADDDASIVIVRPYVAGQPPKD
ncbi:MAG: restriction endonuclease [Alphaproteobacteria bacterium]|nr:restriction endonuclease [Alphaproteobacteria bacterium]